MVDLLSTSHFAFASKSSDAGSVQKCYLIAGKLRRSVVHAMRGESSSQLNQRVTATKSAFPILEKFVFQSGEIHDSFYVRRTFPV